MKVGSITWAPSEYVAIVGDVTLTITNRYGGGRWRVSAMVRGADGRYEQLTISDADNGSSFAMLGAAAMAADQWVELRTREVCDG